MSLHGNDGPASSRDRPDRPRALVVDDEQPLVELMTSYLQREGFDVDSAANGESAVSLAREFDPDVIVLDLMLPGIDGIEACRQIRAFSDAYIVMLTARVAETDKIAGLSTGADDYVTKPFSPAELVARVRAMLRRPRSASPGIEDQDSYRRGPLVIDLAAREVKLDGEPIELTRLEFDLLKALSENPRLVLSRRQLLERVWGPSWFGDEHVIDVHVAKLRKKFGDEAGSPRLIRTVRGVGYAMAAPE